MIDRITERLGQSAVRARSLGALADRVGAVLLPTSVARATGSGGCHLIGCHCSAAPYPECAWMYDCFYAIECSTERCGACEPL